MADIKISDLPQASSVSDADIVVINQGNVTKTATRALINAPSGTLPVANGGTGVTASSGANSVVLRDVNQNITANAYFNSLSSITASAVPVVLTVASAPVTIVTNISPYVGGQVIKLPDATTLPVGTIFSFNNNQSQGAITVNNGSIANTLVVSIPSGGYVTVVLTANADAAGTWDRHDQAPSNVSWSTNTFNYPGSITGATWNGNPVKGTLGTQVKVVGIDSATIQGCIDLCISASASNPFTVLIPPKAGNYVEALTLKGGVALIGLTNALNSDAIQIEGSHTYTPDLASSNSNRIGFQNLTFISALLTANTISVVAGTGGLKYAAQLRFSGCVFSGGKNSVVSHISTCDNVSLYIDNCRFESTTGNAGSVGITQGNGPLYLSNNTVFDVFGKALDIPASTTVTKTATSTFGSYTLTVSDVTGLSVGQKISGTGLYSTTTVVSITAPSTVVMSTPPQTATAGFTATFGQTPYVEIHDSVLAGKGAEVVRLGNGLLTCNTSNFTNTATGGSGINMLTANTVIGMVNSSFSIYDATAYTITAAAATCYAALNGISYSSSLLGTYSTLIGANVAPLDYSARATSVANGGTGQTTYTNGQLLIGNTTGNTLSKATLTAGTGITVTNGTGTITIATSGAGNATNLQGGNNTTLLGSVPYQSNTNVTTLLAPNTTATKKFLRQTGTGTNGAAPAWDTLVISDIPANLNQNTTGTAAGLSSTLVIASGGTGATDAATARTNLSAATFADVQIFAAGTSTWTKPTGAKFVNIQLLGGGGGGGSGRKDSTLATNCFGGGGGGGGSWVNINVPASVLAATESVVVGAGGAGAAAVSTDTTSGSAGTNGGTTYFTINGSTANSIQALGGTGGGGGSTGAGSAGIGVLNANAGAAGAAGTNAAFGNPISAIVSAQFGGPGGGGGGGVGTVNTAFDGGTGGRSNIWNSNGGAKGVADSGLIGTAGNTYSVAATGVLLAGSAGGGGGGGSSVVGGGGGNGGFPAGGAGGGGGTRSGANSGAGGTGGAGVAIITTYF